MALVTLVGCGDALKKRSSTENKSIPEPLIVNKELSYKYTVEGEGACTTGLQNFESKKELCIALQDHKLNNGCATGERSSRFSWDCEDTLGWKWGESVQCDVYALRGKKLEFFLKKEDIITKNSYCAGRTEANDWEMVNEVRDEKVLYKGIKFSFTLRAQSDERYRDFALKFKLTRPDGLVSSESTMDGNILSAQEEDLFDEDARAHITCYTTHGCRNQ